MVFVVIVNLKITAGDVLMARSGLSFNPQWPKEHNKRRVSVQ